MSGDNLQPIIVKKIKKVAAGHHGGAWKVAYADFVTAMMAFFLLLWLLNATTEEQKRGISDYFAPASASKTTSGSGGVLGGLTVSADGAMRNTTTPAGVSSESPSFSGEATQKVENEDEGTGGGGPKDLDEQDLEELLAEREQNEFAKAEAQLRRAIRESPELRQLKENLIIEMTPEGMRIQIIDQAGLALFPLGSSRMFGHTRRLLRQVARVIDKLPNEISISGHTDATPYSSADGYGNWELSTDRANASRRMLIEFGLSPERIAKVIGKADREHLYPGDPTSPRNRRIGIVLLRGTGQNGGTDRRAGPRPNKGIPGAQPLPSSRG